MLARVSRDFKVVLSCFVAFLEVSGGLSVVSDAFGGLREVSGGLRRFAIMKDFKAFQEFQRRHRGILGSVGCFHTSF